jgi:hypothetical protein
MMPGKEPDKSLSAGSFLFSVSSHKARSLVLREANHIQAHAKEQVQPCFAGRAAAPTPPSSQAFESRLPAPCFSGYTGWWRGYHYHHKCGPAPPSICPYLSLDANRRCWIMFQHMFIKSQKCSPYLQA